MRRHAFVLALAIVLATRSMPTDGLLVAPLSEVTAASKYHLPVDGMAIVPRTFPADAVPTIFRLPVESVPALSLSIGLNVAKLLVGESVTWSAVARLLLVQ